MYRLLKATRPSCPHFPIGTEVFREGITYFRYFVNGVPFKSENNVWLIELRRKITPTGEDDGTGIYEVDFCN